MNKRELIEFLEASSLGDTTEIVADVDPEIVPRDFGFLAYAEETEPDSYYGPNRIYLSFQ